MKLALFLALACASSLAASPMPVTGSGWFEFDLLDNTNDWSVVFGGSDGVHSVGVSAYGNGPAASSPVQGAISHSRYDGGIGASIDDQVFSSGFYTFYLGEGGGSITGYDLNGPVTTMPLAGSLKITSETCGGNRLFPACQGTFAVVVATNPEPSTWGMLGIGLGFLLLQKLRKD